jgi:hypothetical protein
VKRRTQLDPDGAAVEEVIRDVHGVLLMEQVHPLFHGGGAELVPPDGQAEVEPELGEMLGARPLEPAVRPLLAADLEARAVREPQQLGEMVQHDGTPERRRQRGDEQSVIAPGRHARHRPRREAAEAIGHEPLAGDRRLARRLAGADQRSSQNRH